VSPGVPDVPAPRRTSGRRLRRRPPPVVPPRTFLPRKRYLHRARPGWRQGVASLTSGESRRAS
jgi:hypothetical protein